MTGAEYNHINDVIEDLYEDGKLTEEDFDNLCKWIDEADKSEKYKWHDLLKNPNDLPEEGIYNKVLVARVFSGGNFECFTAKYCTDFGKKCWEVNELHQYTDVPVDTFRYWKHIEQFE